MAESAEEQSPEPGLVPDSAHLSETSRLRRIVKGHEGFRLVILQFNDHAYRDRLIAAFGRELSARPGLLHATRHDTFAAFENALYATAAGHDLIHVIGLETWLAGEAGVPRIHGFNYHREPIAKHCRLPLLLWMPEPLVRAFATGAPDMWSWRAGLLDYSLPRATSTPVPRACRPPETMQNS